MTTLILFNKPYGVLSQFSDHDGHPGLKHYLNYPDVYPMGRLDRDSEGLLLLSDNGQLQARIADPKYKMEKTYLVQLEGEITKVALDALASGLMLNDGMTKPAKVKEITQPAVWPRNPPIRQRMHQKTCWIELRIKEGRNRQVRRMTAAVGFPTLRLIRSAIGPWQLGDLKPEESRQENIHLPKPHKPLPARTHNKRSRKI
ncbi:MAG: pseudouridine synthase [Porticoccaceae bacterium]|nr:MAG: pseudouridine synthase [Porticoccaceae bacterium]